MIHHSSHNSKVSLSSSWLAYEYKLKKGGKGFEKLNYEARNLLALSFNINKQIHHLENLFSFQSVSIKVLKQVKNFK